MSGIGSLVERLVAAGLSIAEASEIIAAAFAAGAAGAPLRKSPGALRQEKWRERLKASQSVTDETPRKSPEPASQSVSNRLETSQRDAASLSIDKKENQKKEKKERERASQLPPEWRPDEASWTEGVSILGSPDRAELELKKFRNHAAEKGRTSKRWCSAWANWAIKAVEYGGRSGNGSSAIRTNSASQQSGSAPVFAGVAAATERRARERVAAGQQRPVPVDADPPPRDDVDLFREDGRAAAHR